MYLDKGTLKETAEFIFNTLLDAYIDLMEYEKNEDPGNLDVDYLEDSYRNLGDPAQLLMQLSPELHERLDEILEEYKA